MDLSPATRGLSAAFQQDYSVPVPFCDFWYEKVWQHEAPIAEVLCTNVCCDLECKGMATLLCNVAYTRPQ